MIENLSIQLYNSHTLWLSLISLQSTTFTTTGRGSIPGTPFSFTVSRNPSAGGRHYAGGSIPGYGNELWIVVDGVRRERSISRSTIDRAYAVAVEKGGKVKGPKSLGVPGAGSYLYPIFVRLGVITTDPQQVSTDAHTAGEQQTDTAE